MANDAWGQGIDTLDYTDQPDLVVLGQTLRDGLTPRSVMRFADATSRDAAVASPVAGMIAWLTATKVWTGFDGTAWVALAAGTQAWTTPTLATGYTANGNSNGVPQYRVVNLFGDLVVMWRGGLGVTYTSGAPANSGNFLHDPLPAGARPTTFRTVTAACSAVSSESLSVKIDFKADGTSSIVTQSGVQPPWVSLNNIMYSLTS
ncbi:hypothetical protein RVR_8334 [Actinacidiphila reveromycinica]|uniref:Uncharacterized protein n=1 Tax=Actinacidiphila reveromycinica TaxID=659352 RepID=A0A7U3VRQ1_9ACTN|nr:hypothetical protein [Streptomyces sp. SN-593]BBB01083.1 hypothetical protein RVR_8334 [Streptomyces sp. SN-593]